MAAWWLSPWWAAVVEGRRSRRPGARRLGRQPQREPPEPDAPGESGEADDERDRDQEGKRMALRLLPEPEPGHSDRLTLIVAR